MQHLILYDPSSNMKFTSVQDFLGFHYLEDIVLHAMWMRQGPAFHVIDKLVVVSDMSTANQVPSDREILSTKGMGRKEK